MVKSTKKVSKGKPASGKPTGKKQGTSAPAAMGMTRSPQQPRMAVEGGSVIVKRRELCDSIALPAGAGFSVVGATNSTPGYDITPSNDVLFPWLSRIASNYEKYRFRALSFTLVTAAATNETGRLYMAVDPDWDDEVPGSAPELLGRQMSISGNAWLPELRLTCNCTQLNEPYNWRYCSASTRRVTVTEPRVEYAGFLSVACQGLSTNGLAVELWSEYEVELRIPTGESPVLDSMSNTSLKVDSTPSANYYWPVFPANASKSLGVVSAVAAGIASAVSGVDVKPTQVLEIARVARGLGSFRTTVATNGTATPFSDIGLYRPNPDIYMWSRDGTALGTYGDGKVVGSESGSSASTEGASWHTQLQFSIGNMLKLNPSVAYIMPVVKQLGTLAGVVQFLQNSMNLKFEL